MAEIWLSIVVSAAYKEIMASTKVLYVNILFILCTIEATLDHKIAAHGTAHALIRAGCLTLSP